MQCCDLCQGMQRKEENAITHKANLSVPERTGKSVRLEFMDSPKGERGSGAGWQTHRRCEPEMRAWRYVIMMFMKPSRWSRGLSRAWRCS